MKINGIVTANISKIDDIFLSSMSKVSGIALPVAASSYLVATGGLITRDGDYLVHTFRGSDNFNIQSLSSTPAYNSLQYLIVGGGASGGNSANAQGGGGGGGAGQFITNSFLATISSLPVVIGAGGSVSPTTGVQGFNGSSTTFNSITASGGGGGGGSTLGLRNGLNGASGGGGGWSTGIGGTGITYNGGNGAGPEGAGGAGAGQNGFNGVNGVKGGNGGNGLQSSITGTATYYAGGGGGGDYILAGTGGLGGGGNGARQDTTPSVTGLINSGSGGGGGYGNLYGPGALGGSGIVVVRYFSPQTVYIVASGGSVTRDGDYLVHTFTGSDTLNITQLSSNPTYNSLEYLIVAGGGGGGASVLSGGGGGAGGFLTGTFTPTVSNYSLVIGAGGATTFNEGDGVNGFDSTGLSLTSVGGGGGARGYLGYFPAGNGGSGGGGGALNGGAGLNGYPGTGTVGQGFDGGYAYGGPGYAASGAGGGAGAIGNDADGSQGGNGGPGQFSLISGTSIYYAGGGAGGSYANTPGTGGIGGGGNGTNSGAGTDGTVNLGAGGGGGKITSSGGSGIIIVRYFSPQTYVQAFTDTVINRGGSLTANEITYLTTFETSMGSDLAEFDRLWIHGLSNEIAAKTSFVNPASTIVTAVNSPTFTPGLGYQGDGTTSYLNTNFTPSTQAVKYTQSSASIFVYSLTNTIGNYVDVGIVAGTNKSFLYTRYTNGSAYYPVNMNTSIGSPFFTLTNSLGFYVGNLNSTTLSLNKNGAQLVSTTITPVAVPTVPFYLLAYNSTGTPEARSINQISVSGMGSGIVNQSNFYNSIQTLGTSLGWFSYTTKFKAVVSSRGGTLTSAEESYLRTFEASMGSDLGEFDRLWIHGLSNEIAARTSFVNPTSTAITAVNNPTFTPNVGFIGNGTTSYLNTNYNASTQGVKYTLNNAGAFAYIRDNFVSTGSLYGTYNGTNAGAFLYPQFNTNTPIYYINSAGADSLGTGNSFGLTTLLRTSSTLAPLYKNAIYDSATTRSSTSIPNLNHFILGFNFNGNLNSAYSKNISASGFGGANYNQSNFYNSLQTLGTSLGWAVILNNVSAFNRLSDNTTSARNSTGAKLIVITVTSYTLGNFPTITDNLGNMWISVGFADGTQAARISTFYCINPTTSTSHTFTVVAASAYPSLSVNMFGGPSFTFDKYSSNTGGNLISINSGSITPSSSRNLVITAVNYWVGDTANSITDGFIITNSIPAQASTLSGSTAYKLNSGTVNPTWSWTNYSGDTAAMITSFTY